MPACGIKVILPILAKIGSQGNDPSGNEKMATFQTQPITDHVTA